MYKIARNSKKIRTYSSPYSIDLGVNRKSMYDFLLVINSNFGRFEILTFKVRKWRVFPTPHLFDAP